MAAAGTRVGLGRTRIERVIFDVRTRCCNFSVVFLSFASCRIVSSVTTLRSNVLISLLYRSQIVFSFVLRCFFLLRHDRSTAAAHHLDRCTPMHFALSSLLPPARCLVAIQGSLDSVLPVDSRAIEANSSPRYASSVRRPFELAARLHRRF